MQNHWFKITRIRAGLYSGTIKPEYVCDDNLSGTLLTVQGTTGHWELCIENGVFRAGGVFRTLKECQRMIWHYHKQVIDQIKENERLEKERTKQQAEKKLVAEMPVRRRLGYYCACEFERLLGIKSKTSFKTKISIFDNSNSMNRKPLHFLETVFLELVSNRNPPFKSK